MKRPLCIASIFYIIGILIGLYLHLSMALFLIIGLVIIIFTYALTKKKDIVIFLIILLLGITQIKLVDISYEEKYKLIYQESIQKIQAVIISEPEEKEYKVAYKVKIAKIDDEEFGIFNKTEWILNVNKSNNTNLNFGDMIEFVGEFKIPDEARNYKGFDYKKYLKSQGIYGNINLKNEAEVIENNKSNKIDKILYDISTNIKSKMSTLLPEDISPLCIGILIGDRNNIQEEITNAFKDSNLTHMLAVSGAHISYVIIALSIMLSKTESKFRKIVIIIFLIFFIGLTGLTPSIMRAGIMAILTIVASLLHRKADIYNNLAISAIIILLKNPYSILNIGFELSYLGTIGIVLCHKKISELIKRALRIKEDKDSIKEKQKENKEKINIKNRIYIFMQKLLINIIDLFSLTISANLVISPIMAINFHTISLSFWISNILAGPFLGIILILGYVTYFISLFSFKLASIISIPLKICLKILIKIAKICSKLPLSSIDVKLPYTFETIIYYGFILFILNYKKIEKRLKKIIAIIMIVILVVGYTTAFFLNRELRIYFVDVGQGDCTLICTPSNKTILIDGGGSENSSFDVGKNTLFPYLLSRRIDKIDYMMISHFDSDHIGGLFYILENLEVKNIIISKQAEISQNYLRLKELLQEKKINIILVEKGSIVKIDKNTYFDIIFPEEDMILSNSLNNNSIVTRFIYKNFSILFTGDIESKAEERIIEEYKEETKLQSTIIKIAHHGSKTSSTQEFLDLVNPKIALIGVGQNNNFGHPNEEVLQRLENINAKIYRTDENGEIELRVNKKGKIRIKAKFN